MAQPDSVAAGPLRNIRPAEVGPVKTTIRYPGDDPARDRKAEKRDRDAREFHRLSLGLFVIGKRKGAAPLTRPWNKPVR